MLDQMHEQATVLAVGVGLPQPTDTTLSMFECSTLRGTVEMLRISSFDLLLVGTNVVGTSALDLVRRIRNVWPSLKWAMVGTDLTPADEIAARSLGCICIFDETPSEEQLTDLAVSVSRRIRRSRHAGAEVSHA